MNHKILGSFIQFTQQNYHLSNLTVDYICSKVKCSKSYLHEILVSEYSVSVKQYLECYRLLKSIELLIKGEKKVYLKTGFTSCASFSRTFKRATGLTVREISGNLRKSQEISGNQPFLFRESKKKTI